MRVESSFSLWFITYCAPPVTPWSPNTCTAHLFKSYQTQAYLWYYTWERVEKNQGERVSQWIKSIFLLKALHKNKAVEVTFFKSMEKLQILLSRSVFISKLFCCCSPVTLWSLTSKKRKRKKSLYYIILFSTPQEQINTDIQTSKLSHWTFDWNVK